MKLLVTGATGFIGRQVIAKLKDEEDVHAITSKSDCPDVPNVHWHTVDLFDEEAVEKLMAEVQPTHLLHLAWITDHGGFWESDKNEGWLETSKHLVHAFLKHGGERIVATGSCAEYDWSEGHCTEDVTPLEPHTLYGKTKKTFYEWLQSIECSTAWARIFHLYGPHEDPRRLVSSAILTLMKNEQFETSAGTQLRNFLHVEDVASAILTILQSGKEGAINIGAPTNVTIREVLEEIGTQLEKRDKIAFGALPMREGDPTMLTPDTHVLQQLAWKPSYTLEKGIQKTIEWWHEHQASH